jgi:hypothetical protein
VIDWGLDVELPRAFLDALRPTAAVYRIKVRDGVVVEAPGVLDLGRSTRLANASQRRALRVLYATCAIPGCRVGYGRTKLHHVVWWRHGGHTDLENFLPVCVTHHHKIHNDGWLVSLGPHRELTITLPDGQIMTTGPPRRTVGMRWPRVWSVLRGPGGREALHGPRRACATEHGGHGATS